jgi:DNA-binding winged helix-turn-helix (wHTH) protein/tetratricopeptide (TPR) repeat protein
MSGNHHPQTVIAFGPFEADLQTQELRRQGERVRLPGQSFQILKILLERPGEPATREELQKALWPSATFVDFEYGVNAAVHRLREALEDSADSPRLIETLPRLGYRFIGTITKPPTATNATASEKTGGKEQRTITWRVVLPAAVTVVALAALSYFYFQRNPKLTNKDTIVLADFTNSTGDPVFDGTLRQGLAVELEQSPFLRLLSEEQIQQTLRMMKQSPDAKLTPEITWQICQRTNSTTILNASIAQIGTQYNLILKAVSCVDGQLIGSTEAQANDKNHVLEALGRASEDIRKKLGESTATLQKFDTPLEQATTPSLEALQAYTLGFRALTGEGGSGAAIPMLQQATKLDPNFAMAWVILAACYHNLGELTLASENARKAFELRSGTSERERLLIEDAYHFHVTGDLQQALRVNEVRVQTYPNDPVARSDLGILYAELGQYDKSLAEHRESVHLYPVPILYGNLIVAYIALNRFDEARTTLDEAKAKNPDFPSGPFLYLLAFLGDDSVSMTNATSCCEAAIAAYSGQLEKARTVYRKAVVSATRAEEKEAAAASEASAALIEALFGNTSKARQRAESALRLSNGRDTQCGAALALALVGDTARAQMLTDDLSEQFPESTVVQFNYLPTIRAQLALNRKSALEAIETLRTAEAYDFGSVGIGTFYPVYVRGLAYLAAHKGTEAAAEFQKVLDHRGIVMTSPIGALVRLQMGRAYTVQGDTAKARAAYSDFLTLWKDADSDIPLLKQAKAEYAKLK